MRNKENICRALSKIAWAHVFLYLYFNLGMGGYTVNVLPDWMCYLLLWSAIPLLEDELRDLRLLKPFCILLGVWAGIVWVKNALSWDIGTPFLWAVLVTALSMYVHFQLLTALAQGIGSGLFGVGAPATGLQNRLTVCRDVGTVLRTVQFAMIYLLDLGTDIGIYDIPEILMLLMLIAQFIVMLVLVVSLFDLRKYVRQEPERAEIGEEQ